MHKKSVMALLVSAALATTLSACGGDDDDNSNSSGQSSSAVSSSAANSSASSSAASSNGGASSSAMTVAWNAYNANVAPTTDGSITASYGTATVFKANAGTGYVSNLFVPDGTGAVSFNDGAGSKSQVRLSGSVSDSVVGAGYPKYFTWVGRMKSNNTTDRAFEIEVGLGDDDSAATASRVKLVVADAATGVYIDTLDGTSTSKPVVAADTSAYHTYQLAVTLTAADTGTVNLYVDGQPATTTSASTVSLPYTGKINPTSGTTKRYLGIGTTNSSATPYNGSLDWFVWTNQGAYTPAQLKGSLPSGIGDTAGY
ncbi:MAG: hypothetical protein QM639_12160 [Rhodocyclaceae bacterium]